LIAIKPISAGQLKAIRNAIQQLPSDSIGFRYDALITTGAPMMRLGFSSDDSWDFGGLEVSGFFPGWLEPLTRLISSLSRPEAPIAYPQMILEYRQLVHADSYAPPVRKIKMREYYGQPKPWWKFWGS
jgi:hypothetical protein